MSSRGYRGSNSPTKAFTSEVSIMVILSMAWVSMNPSRLTMQGSCTSRCSAMRGAMIELSYACWTFSENSWIHPVSRADMASPWSLLMLMGPLMALLATAIMRGTRIADAMGSISHM